MAIDILKDEIFPLYDLRKRVGLDRSNSTLKRWCDIGVVTMHSRKPVKLERIYQGNIPCTSLPAYYRFMFRLNNMPIPDHLATQLKEEPE